MTSTTHRPIRPLRILAVAAAVCLALLAGCADQQETATGGDGEAPTATGWPRTIIHEKGETEIPAAPERIVSTSLSLTGTLLAIDAPVIGSGATGPNTPVTDENGFFTQWADVAVERGVKAIYQNSEPSVEAVLAEDPDLIIVSATGGDSAVDLYDQLAQIAPTVVIDYSDKSWEELAPVLGEATGHEVQAEEALVRYEATVAETKAKITLPPQPTSAFVFYGDENAANLWTPESAQGKLLASVGFEIAELPDDLVGDKSMGERGDIIELSGESLEPGLNGNTYILITPSPDTKGLVLGHTLLQNNPAVTEGHVYAMDPDSFRLDYFSATNMLAALADQLG